MPDIPPPTITVNCGVCGGELEPDYDDPNDGFVCQDCQITYATTHSSGDYLNPEEEPCGKPFHMEARIEVTKPFKTTRAADGTTTTERWRTEVSEYGSCDLPASHARGLHHWPVTVRHEYHDHDPRST